MSNIRVNPEELRRFAGELARYAENLLNETSQIDSAFAQLSETWQDSQRSRFDEDFNELKNMIRKFSETTKEHEAHLNALAQRGDDYLNA